MSITLVLQMNRMTRNKDNKPSVLRLNCHHIVIIINIQSLRQTAQIMHEHNYTHFSLC